jgi:hypothetical protein
MGVKYENIFKWNTFEGERIKLLRSGFKASLCDIMASLLRSCALQMSLLRRGTIIDGKIIIIIEIYWLSENIR